LLLLLLQLTNTIYYDRARSWYYCYVRIRAFDAQTGVALSGITIDGTWGVSPDVDWYTDWYAEMPYGVFGNLGTATSGFTDSPWIPVRATLRAWYPNLFTSAYTGARCTFTLNSVTHPNYVLDRSVSTTFLQSSLL
jgi:hypothetical protein